MSGTTTVTPKLTATRGRKSAAKKASKRKTNKPAALPSRTKTPMNQGIYIPASRVKHYLDSAGLNKKIEDAITELRDAEPHDEEITTLVKNEKTKKPKKEVTGTRRTELISWDKLSEATRSMVGEARSANDEREKALDKAEKAHQERLKEMSPDERKRYDDKLTKAEAEDAARIAERQAKAAQLAEDIKSGKVDAKKHPVRGPKKTTKYGTEIELLSKMRIRFAKDASQQAAATICAFAHERTKFAIQNCIKHELKIVKVRHALEKGHDLMPFASLIRNLPAYREGIQDEEQRVADELRLKEEKKAAKKAAKEAKDGEEVAVVAAVVPQVEEEEEEDDDASFGHYVRQVAHNVMNEELKSFVPKDKKDKHPYEDIRISAEYRDWLSDIIIEFIRRFCPLLNGQIKTWNIKTISRDIVRQTVNIFLEIHSVDTVKANELFDSKFKLYQEYIEKRKAEKKVAADLADVEKKTRAAAAAAAGLPVETTDDEAVDPSDAVTDDEEDTEEESVPVVTPAPVTRRKRVA